MKREATKMCLLESLPQSAINKLHEYVSLIERWKNITNLISKDSFHQVWHRHIEDSILLQRSCPDAGSWLDIGSGAGFPAIVIGVILAQTEGTQIHCVESDGRKCAFLRAVAQKLQIPVKIHQSRIESLPSDAVGKVEIVTARAFSSVRHILAVTQRFLNRGAIVVLPRGRTALKEVEGLDLSGYSVMVTSNPNYDDGVILHIRIRDREL